MIIDVAKEFHVYPWGRKQGEDFRVAILSPKLRDVMKDRNSKLVIDINGCRTLGSSFLEEAFGGLIRVEKFKKSDVKKFVCVKETAPSLAIFADAITEYIDKA